MWGGVIWDRVDLAQSKQSTAGEEGEREQLPHEGGWHRGATLPPPARPHTIFRGIKENSDCTEGRDEIIINAACVCVDGFNLIVFG